MGRIKTVLLGITGGIAAYKSCYIVSSLKKKGIDVIVLMTKNATEFVSPLTFETLSGNKVYIDTFEKHEFEVEHISLAKRGDVFVVAPASADFIAKVNNGVADDMLTTTFLAFNKKKIICPAMNTNMYLNDATKDNIDDLKAKGMIFVGPVDGHLACGDNGIGKMSEPDEIIERIVKELYANPDFLGKHFLITCGGTVEDIDGVRCITNYSSGKMGVAIAEAVKERGGIVTLVSGNVSVAIPKMDENIYVKSTQDMYDACINNLEKQDVIIKAAAPCDFKIKEKASSKIKEKNLVLEFVANPDIAQKIGEIKGDRKLVIFAAETDDLIENAHEKLVKKNADLIVANNVRGENTAFNSDTNQVTLISAFGDITETDRLSKDQIADIILDKIKEL